MLSKSSILLFHMLEMLEQTKRTTESDKIWTKGVIFNAEITTPSNYRSLKHLDNGLKK